MPALSIGPYRVLGKLGAGGMGEVHLAEDTRLGRKVALKTPSDAWLQHADARTRLIREARAAASLNHPNIAAIYDILDLPGRPCIVMEYVEGETLAAVSARERLPVERVVEIAVQLARALEAAHAQGVVHRDLKPGNVCITPGGAVKVLDFGLAKAAVRPASEGETPRPISSISEAGQLLGTPGYTAPEQLLGKPADHRSDLFSVGALLYELAAGRPAFQSPDAMGLALATLTEQPPDADGVNPAVPAALAAVLRRAMAKEPRERYESAAQMRAALERIQADLKDRPTGPLPAAEAAGARGAGGRRPGRRLGIAAAATALVLGIVGAALVGRWPGGDAAPDRVPIVAVLPFENLTGDAASEHLGVGFADSLITRLAGISSVSVVPRRAGADYGHGEEARARAARDLGASYVIGGSVQRAGGRLLVNVSVVDGGSAVVWADGYEAEEQALFALQRSLATGVGEGLRLRLTAADRQRLETPQTRDLEAYRRYSEARALLDAAHVAGNLERAIELFEQAVARDAGFALGHAGLGDAYWRRYEALRDPEWATRAIEVIERAARLDAENPAVRVSLARMYAGTGRAEAAAEEVRAALELQPGSDEARRLLGDLHAAEGRPDDAVQEYQRAIAARPAYWRNHGALGAFYFRTGRYAEAAIAFQRATELQPDNAWAFENLGAAYHAAGDTARAREHYERAVRLAPDTADVAYSNLGVIHYDEGRFEEAVHAFERAVALAPRDPALHRNLGDAYRRHGRPDAAEASYRRALPLAEDLVRLNPTDGRSVALLAVLEAKTGRHADAARHAAEAARLRPADGEVRYREAVVHALAGRAPDALRALSEALDHGYPAARVAADEDFAALRPLPEFKDLLAEGR